VIQFIRFVFCIFRFRPKTKLLETKWDKNEKELWNLFSFTPQENYIGAVSVKGNIQNIKYYNINLSQ
jgi:hypothetical protein